jgi:branched-chain amino acid transport system substrate-binding protein
MRFLVLGLVFCLTVASTAFAEIKIGALFSVSGPASFLGLPEKQTAEMLVEELNKKGGINGEKIKLVVYDTRGVDAEARKKFMRLIQKDKVLAVIGPSTSGETLALKAEAEKRKIPLISCAASRRIVLPVAKYVFKTPQSDYHAVEKIYDYMLKNGEKKVGILSDSNGFGASGRVALIEMAKKMGITIVADEKYKGSDKDMSAQLSKISKENPDAIIVWGAGSPPAIVAKNIKQLGIKTQVFMSHGVASKRFISLAGDAANGIIIPAGRLIVADQLPKGDKYKALLETYAKDYQSRYNAPVSTFGGHAYDAISILAEGIKKGGKDRAKIVEAIENLKNFNGTAGTFNFSKEDHNGLTKDAFVMVKIVNGNWELIK